MSGQTRRQQQRTQKHGVPVRLAVRMKHGKDHHQRTGNAQIHAHAAELADGGGRHQTVYARRMVGKPHVAIRRFVNLHRITSKDRRQPLPIQQECCLKRDKRRQKREKYGGWRFSFA